MTEKQKAKNIRNARVCEAFKNELQRNARRTDAAIIAAISPKFPEIQSPITFRTILGRAGLLNVQQ